MEALQEASESFLLEVLEDANLAARHAKEFITIIVFFIRNFSLKIILLNKKN